MTTQTTRGYDNECKMQLSLWYVHVYVQECNTNPCPVNGAWGMWSAYSICTKSCGGGTMTRTRVCDNPAPAHSGTNCPDVNTESAPCNSHTCPRN